MTSDLNQEFIAPENDPRPSEFNEEFIELAKETLANETMPSVSGKELAPVGSAEKKIEESENLSDYQFQFGENWEEIAAEDIAAEEETLEKSPEESEEIKQKINSLDLEEFGHLVRSELQQLKMDDFALIADPIGLQNMTREPYDDLSSGDRNLSDTDSFHSSKSQIELSGEDIRKTKEEDIKIDRGMYYEMHALYTRKNQEERRKNNYLQTRLAEYYKRKRMYHVLQSDKQISPDYQKKYEKLLSELERVFEENTREEDNAKDEVLSLKMKHLAQKEKVEQLFQKLQKAETDYAKELTIHLDEHSKGNFQKCFDYLLKRQKHGMKDLSKIRLEYLKLSNKYNEAHQNINTLENLSSKFSLLDYEQMKADNRNLHDRLEEKEYQLNTIRQRCQHGMQVLAHTREKLDAVSMEIQSESDRLESVSFDWIELRETVTGMKFERDSYRHKSKKLKDEAGLLSKPKLLKDMEQSINEVEEMKAKIEECKNEYDATTTLLKVVKRRPSSLLLGETEVDYSSTLFQDY